MLISLWQNGHVLVVGSAGASSFLLKESNLLIPFIRQNKIFTQGKCFEFFHKFFHDESSPLYFTLYTNILYSGRRFHWRYWTYRCKRLYQMSCHPYVKRSGSGYHCHECTEKSCKSLPGKRNYYGIFPCEWTADACHEKSRIVEIIEEENFLPNISTALEPQKKLSRFHNTCWLLHTDFIL